MAKDMRNSGASWCQSDWSLQNSFVCNVDHTITLLSKWQAEVSKMNQMTATTYSNAFWEHAASSETLWMCNIWRLSKEVAVALGRARAGYVPKKDPVAIKIEVDLPKLYLYIRHLQYILQIPMAPMVTCWFPFHCLSLKSKSPKVGRTLPSRLGNFHQKIDILHRAVWRYSHWISSGWWTASASRRFLCFYWSKTLRKPNFGSSEEQWLGKYGQIRTFQQNTPILKLQISRKHIKILLAKKKSASVVKTTLLLSFLPHKARSHPVAPAQRGEQTMIFGAAGHSKNQRSVMGVGIWRSREFDKCTSSTLLGKGNMKIWFLGFARLYFLSHSYLG